MSAQNLIIYEREGRPHIYATAYTVEDTKRQIVLCVNRYGRQARVRSVPAEQFPLPAS